MGMSAAHCQGISECLESGQWSPCILCMYVYVCACDILCDPPTHVSGHPFHYGVCKLGIYLAAH